LAAEIYADLYRRGDMIGDADNLVAATSIVVGLRPGRSGTRRTGEHCGRREAPQPSYALKKPGKGRP
jgi:hypothetical protein